MSPVFSCYLLLYAVFIMFYLLDVCGVVHNVGDCTTIIAKATQKELTKRDVELVDDTNMSIRLTVWGDEVSNHYHVLYTIITLYSILPILSYTEYM